MKLFKKIKEWFIWLTSRKVQEAMNNGMDYDEIEKIVEEEMQR